RALATVPPPPPVRGRPPRPGPFRRPPQARPRQAQRRPARRRRRPAGHATRQEGELGQEAPGGLPGPRRAPPADDQPAPRGGPDQPEHAGERVAGWGGGPPRPPPPRPAGPRSRAGAGTAWGAPRAGSTPGTAAPCA